MNQYTGMKGDYGIDAPPAIRNLVIWGVAAMLAGFSRMPVADEVARLDCATRRNPTVKCSAINT